MIAYPILLDKENKITVATNALPISITTEQPHHLETGDAIDIADVVDNTNANGSRTVTKVSSTVFTLDDIKGNALYQALVGKLLTRSLLAAKTHPGVTALLGDVHRVDPTVKLSDTCRFVASAPTTVAAGADKVDVRLQGRVNQHSDWIEVAKLDDGDTWTVGDVLFQATAETVKLYPEMRIRVVASGGSTNTVRAWLVI